MTTDVLGYDVVDDRDMICLDLWNAEGKKVVVVIPAYNEEASIVATVASVQAQTHPATTIIVAANNCTDATAENARKAGAYVFIDNENRDKKAGALNTCLNYIMDYLDDTDVILVADADTQLSHDFVAVGLAHMQVRRVGGVGGAFIGRSSTTWIGLLQAIEFYRYRQQIKFHGERAFVLSGTGSLLSVRALRDVRAARQNGTLPYGESFYDTFSLTEDNELTFAMRSLGWVCLSPMDMTTTTDVMESLGALWHQRLRWYLGALRNLSSYRRHMPWRIKTVYWGQQLGLVTAVLTWILQFALMVWILLWGPGFGGFVLLWPLVGVVQQLLKVVSVRKMGSKARWAMFLLEPLYCIYLLLIFCGAVSHFIAGKKGEWIAT